MEYMLELFLWRSRTRDPVRPIGFLHVLFVIQLVSFEAKALVGVTITDTILQAQYSKLGLSKSLSMLSSESPPFASSKGLLFEIQIWNNETQSQHLMMPQRPYLESCRIAIKQLHFQVSLCWCLKGRNKKASHTRVPKRRTSTNQTLGVVKSIR